MRYGKNKVTMITDEVVATAIRHCPDLADSVEFEREIMLLKEEYELVDRRISALPEYATAVVEDFLEFKLSYKDMMLKYHCSARNLISLLDDCAESDDRVKVEIEARRKVPPAA